MKPYAKTATPSSNIAASTRSSCSITVTSTASNSQIDLSRLSSNIPSYAQPTVASISKDKRVRFTSPTTIDSFAASQGELPRTKASSHKKSAPTIIATNDELIQKTVKDTRSSYGDNHAATEDKMMIEHTNLLLSRDLIDEETSAQLSKPWHEKGVLDMQYSHDYLAALNSNYLEDAPEIMDLKEAERIQRRKDAQQKKFLEDYSAGNIDANGDKIETKEFEALEDMDIDVEQPDELGYREAEVVEFLPTKKAKKKEEKEDPMQRVLAMIEDQKKKSKTKGTPPPLRPQKKSTTKAPPKSKPQLKKLPSKKTPASAVPSITPAPGRPDYSEYNYEQCAAICGERNIKSGGGVIALREKLIEDDWAIINGTERDAKNYTSRETGDKKRKTIAPVVPNAPKAAPAVFGSAKKAKGKRKERDEDGSDEEKENKRLKVSA